MIPRPFQNYPYLKKNISKISIFYFFNICNNGNILIVFTETLIG